MPNVTQHPRRTVGRPRRYIEWGHVRELRSRGLSYRAIARSTGLGYGTVRRALLAIEKAVAVTGN